MYIDGLMGLLKRKPDKEVAKLKKWYAEELKRRDDEIEQLKEKNLALLKAAMNQSRKLEDMKIKLEKAMKK